MRVSPGRDRGEESRGAATRTVRVTYPTPTDETPHPQFYDSSSALRIRRASGAATGEN